MFEGAPWFQPDPFLGVLVCQEKAILVGVAKAFDFGEALTNLGAGFERGSLQKKLIILTTEIVHYIPEENRINKAFTPTQKKSP